jgi:hypothetical protein
VELRGFEPMAIAVARRSPATPLFANQCAQPAISARVGVAAERMTGRYADESLASIDGQRRSRYCPRQRRTRRWSRQDMGRGLRQRCRRCRRGLQRPSRRLLRPRGEAECTWGFRAGSRAQNSRSRSARMEGRCSGLKLAPASPPPDRLSGFETRKLAAILAADIVGFSRLTDADEDRTLASQPRY